MKYNFLKNVEKHIKQGEEGKKKILLGRVVSSLLRPMHEVMNLTVSKQINDMSNLLNSLYGTKNKS